MLISICIPSYNRPKEIRRLLESIDCNLNDIEIVICEDNSPQRLEIRNEINKFSLKTNYDIKYFENETNLGYDSNLRNLINKSKGEYVIFMGDDDRFFPNTLDKYISFVKANKSASYILRSYYAEHPNGRLELFKYLNKSKTLKQSIENCSFLYKRN